MDKRDLRRLLNEQSVGWRLEDSLAAYFGDDFVEAVFRPVVGDRGSQRLREIERARAAARPLARVSLRTAATFGWCLRKLGLGLHRLGGSIEQWALGKL